MNDLLDKIKYLTMTDVRKVWMPDTFFRNEKIGRFHNILTPNLYVRVFPNGDILYSIRWLNIKPSLEEILLLQGISYRDLLHAPRSFPF